MSTATGDLRALVATWGLGGVVNAIDQVAKQHGTSEMPPWAMRAAAALLALISELGLDQADALTASDVWRGRP